TCSCVCLNNRLGFSPYRPSAGRRDGCTYATLYGSGPSTRRKVSGAIVPAPTSTSYGCCNTQPRSAQNLCKRRISSWNVVGLELAVTIGLCELVDLTYSYLAKN